MVCTPLLYAQSAETKTSTISYDGTGTYWMVERSDLRRYDNGRYTGLMQREIRSFVYPTRAPHSSEFRGSMLLNAAAEAGVGSWFDGSFYVDEKTLSNMQQTASGLDGSIPATFYISPNGELTPIVDNGFPTFRSFPAFPQEDVGPGDTWEGNAVRSVDPLNKGVYTKLPMVVQYTFVGEEVYQGEDVYRIKAQWATRYGRSYWDYDGDADLKYAMGGHKADIIVLQDTGAALLIRDNVDETFEYHDGSVVQFKGTIHLFTEFPPSINTEDLLPALGQIASITPAATESFSPAVTGDSVTREGSTPTDGSTGGRNLPQMDGFAMSKDNTQIIEPTNNMVVEQTPAGLRLSVRNINFLPDSAEFADEGSRLDMIADTLKTVPNSKFLIEGHTASVGRPEGERQLSFERAQRTADELVKRGISADRFISNGFGGERPIASNDTEEGRAANRRVEITILE